MEFLKVAIDGPAGAGKSTIARALARKLDLIYLDTGAMYRALGLKAFRAGVSVDDEAELSALMDETVIEIIPGGEGDQQILLDGENVSREIRLPEASARASAVSRFAAVREKLVKLQQAFAEGHPVVMDGRDIGTVVLPDAPYKFYLTAADTERARRRVLQLEEKGEKPDYDTILKQIRDRDYQDSHRAASPLKPAEDAIIVDNTFLDQASVLNLMLTHMGRA